MAEIFDYQLVIIIMDPTEPAKIVVGIDGTEEEVLAVARHLLHDTEMSLGLKLDLDTITIHFYNKNYTGGSLFRHQGILTFARCDNMKPIIKIMNSEHEQRKNNLKILAKCKGHN